MSTRQPKPRVRKMIATIWPSKVVFWKVQILVLLGAVLFALALQVLFVFVEDVTTLPKDISFNWILTVALSAVIVVPVFIHGHYEIKESWRLTENRILRKKKEVQRFYNIAEVVPGWFGVVLHCYDGSAVRMLYVERPKEIAIFIEKAVKDAKDRLQQ